MLYIKDTLPSRRDYDGRFAVYETVNSLPHASIVLMHLRRCAYIVGPIMRRHCWKFPMLTELPIESPNLDGMTSRRERTFCKRTGRFKESGVQFLSINLKIRHETKPDMLMAMHVIVQTLLHELAHIKHVEHGLPFYWENVKCCGS
jgi:hypothetical protein